MHQANHDADSYRRVEVIAGGRRRREWSEAEKARIVAESAVPAAIISEIADARMFVPPGADVATLKNVVAALRSMR